MKEELEDTKEVIRILKSKDRQHNVQIKKGQKDKQRSTKHTHKTKYQVTRMKTKLNSSHRNQKSKLRRYHRGNQRA
jgi:hypothetical protein